MTRLVLVLATLAALCGAPSSLLAASPDASPQVAPADRPASPEPDGAAGTPRPTPSTEPGPAKPGRPTAQPRDNEAPGLRRPTGRDGRGGRPGAHVRPGRGRTTRPASPAGASPELASGALAPSGFDDERLLQLGIVVGAAAVLLLGTGWLLTAQGREPRPPQRATARGRRRQRAAADDPVLAALGLEDDDRPATGP